MDGHMRKWTQQSFEPEFQGCKIEAHITWAPEGDDIMVTVRRYGLPGHHELGETFDRFNRTLPGLLNAIRAVIEGLVDLSEWHGIEHGVLEVAEVTDLPEHDPLDPF